MSIYFSLIFQLSFIYLIFLIMENLDRFYLRILFQNWEHCCFHATLTFTEIITCTFSRFCLFFFFFHFSSLLFNSSLSCNVFIAIHFLSMWLVCFVGVLIGFCLSLPCLQTWQIKVGVKCVRDAVVSMVVVAYLMLGFVMRVFLGFWEMELRS